jgi:hypothetical protein
LAGLLSLPVSAAFADCAKDIDGEVFCGAGRCVRDADGIIWCSRFYEGGAEMTSHGRVVCGRGQCAKDTRGRIFCSSIVGGAVLKDIRGRVRCYGKCEAAGAALCENTRADISD